MSYINTTTHYGLPQYTSTDHPKYLTDFNETMAAIDTQMYTNAQAAATADGKAVAAKDVADGAVSSIGTLNTQINGDPTDPSDTGLAGAVSGIDTDLNTVQSLIGSGSPTTSNQTIIGAINDIEASVAPAEDSATLGANYDTGAQFARGGKLYTALVDLTAGTAFTSLVLNTDYKESDPVVKQLEDADAEIQTLANKVDTSHLIRGYDAISVTADGVKTKSVLLDELHAAFVAYVAAATGKIGLSSLITGYTYSVPSRYFTPFTGGSNISWAQLGYVAHGASSTAVGIEVINMVSSGSVDTNVECNSSGNTITDLGATVPADGTEFTLELVLYT